MPTDQSFWGSIIAGLQTMLGQGKPAYSTQQKPPGEEQAYSSFYPSYEITSPQYPTPNPYFLAQQGYRTNDLVYACINERSTDVKQAPLIIRKDDGSDAPEEVIGHPITKLLKRPCPGVNQKMMWEIIEKYLLIAGFSCWEKERNNFGEVIRLWPMRPDWCSFYRGEGQPIRAVRYQPYGLPALDIPINDVVMFQFFDPLWPLLKGFSPTMAAMKVIGVDTSITDMLDAFVHNGAFLGGVLKTEQAITDAEAQRIRDRWKLTHGGSENAGDIAVFGKGVGFDRTNNTFREMQFDQVDGRSETRICTIYRVSPILIGSKVGMGTITENNYKEARQSQTERVTIPEWEYFADVIWEQLLPDFETDPDQFLCEFDLRKVKILQEDRNQMVERATKLYTSKIATLNEAREEIGLDPDDGERGEGYYDDRPAAQMQLDANGQPIPPDKSGKLPTNKPGEEKPKEPPKEEAQPAKAEKSSSILVEQEVMSFRAFAKKRIKEGKVIDIPEYEFKHVDPEHAVALVAMYTAPALISRIDQALESVSS